MSIKKQYIGKVINNRMQKTLVVSILKYKNVACYQKSIKTYKTFFVHNNLYNNSEIPINSIILFKQSRPISKNKKWTLIKKII